jgi:hypothetical protein
VNCAEAVSAAIPPDLRPALEVLRPRPSWSGGASRRGRLPGRELTPFTPLAVDVAVGGRIADGGRAAESEGDAELEAIPLMPFVVIWTFSGRFTLFILRHSPGTMP